MPCNNTRLVSENHAYMHGSYKLQVYNKAKMLYECHISYYKLKLR
jgi:hypothetical protein